MKEAYNLQLTYTCRKPNLACLHSLPVHVGLHTIITFVQPTDGERAIYSLTTLQRLHHNSNYNHTKYYPQKLRSHGRTTELTSKPTIQRKRHINVDCFKFPPRPLRNCRRWQAWLPLWSVPKCPRHFGTGAEVSDEVSDGHFGTGAEVSWCRSVCTPSVSAVSAFIYRSMFLLLIKCQEYFYN